jgi:hypothetical protein
VKDGNPHFNRQLDRQLSRMVELLRRLDNDSKPTTVTIGDVVKAGA